MTLDLHSGDLRVAVERRGDRLDDRVRPTLDDRAIRLEVDLLEDDDVVLFDEHEATVGAAVLVLEAVVGLRLVRTRVVVVQDTVVVVIRVGAAVFVLEAVHVLGIVWTEIVRVEDAVVVVVGVGAAVLVLEAVAILGVVRALVDVVEDAIPVAVAFVAFGAAVFVGVAVTVLGDQRALVVVVEDTVAIVVGVRTAVFVGEVVEVLGLVGALVDVVLVAVTIAVADARLEDEGGRRADVGGLEGVERREVSAAGEHQVAVALDEDLETDEAFHAQRRRIPERVRELGAVDFADDVEGVGGPDAHAQAVGDETAGELDVGGLVVGRENGVGGVATRGDGPSTDREGRSVAEGDTIPELESETEATARAPLADQGRPEGHSRSAGETRGVAGGQTHAEDRCQAEGVLLGAEDAHLAVDDDVAEALLVQAGGHHAAVVHGRVRVGRARNCDGSALGEVDGQLDAQDQSVRDAVVEVERAGHVVVDDVSRAVCIRSHHVVLVHEAAVRQDVSAVVEDQPEAEVAVSEDVRAVDRQVTFRVHRRAKQVEIEPARLKLCRRLRHGAPSEQSALSDQSAVAHDEQSEGRSHEHECCPHDSHVFSASRAKNRARSRAYHDHPQPGNITTQGPATSAPNDPL